MTDKAQNAPEVLSPDRIDRGALSLRTNPYSRRRPYLRPPIAVIDGSSIAGALNADAYRCLVSFLASRSEPLYP